MTQEKQSVKKKETLLESVYALLIHNRREIKKIGKDVNFLMNGMTVATQNGDKPPKGVQAILERLNGNQITVMISIAELKTLTHPAKTKSELMRAIGRFVEDRPFLKVFKTLLKDIKFLGTFGGTSLAVWLKHEPIGHWFMHFFTHLK